MKLKTISVEKRFAHATEPACTRVVMETEHRDSLGNPIVIRATRNDDDGFGLWCLERFFPEYKQGHNWQHLPLVHQHIREAIEKELSKVT